ncbi:MAG TPA: adenylate/guanylate cyclase domain-containing protein [Kiloniellaceae bacterium]|nr:adenylate/guanylate cyclase domain-containing protein [Kiloniellaceae bacterium]
MLEGEKGGSAAVTTNILAVDDEPDLEVLLRQKFRRQIREGRLKFAFARDGMEAVARLQAEPETDVVLTDINMPRMDGLELLSKLHDICPMTRAVIVSAYGDMGNIRTAMNRGAFDFVTKPIDFRDLEVTLNKTCEEVQRAKETLKAIKENDILRMYVDENVISFMTDPQFQNHLLANEEIDATVMFVDICNFTAIAEDASADRVVGMLNRLFDQIVPEIIAQQGTVDKFIGDAVMTLFRGDFHRDRALEAAVALRNKLTGADAQAGDADLPPIQVSIGVNSGRVVSGNIGSESLARLDFTVIGDVVNTAARFQDAAKPGQILIGEDIYEAVKLSFECEPVGEFSLKNKAKPIMLYNVLR